MLYTGAMGGWSWVFWPLGVMVLVLGTSFVLRGRWKDVGRGTLRCSKCWYPMEGVASDYGKRMCPECGLVAEGDEPLLRVRRRGSMRLVGVGISIVGGALLLTPRVVDHGVFSVLPTTVLLVLEPYFHEDRYCMPDDTAAFSPVPPTSPIAEELARRDAAATMSPWQWSLYLDRARLVKIRPSWPKDLPVAYAWRTPSWLTGKVTPGVWTSNRFVQFSVMPVVSERFNGGGISASRSMRDLLTSFYLEPPDSTGWSRYRCAGSYYQYDQSGSHQTDLFSPATGRVKVSLVETADDAIQADADASVGEILRKECPALVCFRPETHMGRPAPRFALRTSAYSLPPHLAYGLSIEVRRDGQTVVVGSMKNPRERVYFENFAHIELSRWMYEDYQVDPTLSRWDVVVRGDARASLRELEKSSYWSGEFVVPVRFEP